MVFALLTAGSAVHTVIPNPHTRQTRNGGAVDKPYLSTASSPIPHNLVHTVMPFMPFMPRSPTLRSFLAPALGTLGLASLRQCLQPTAIM
jgi:hypothetical protein